MAKKILRVGVLGTCRGQSYIAGFNMLENAEITAICDYNPQHLESAKPLINDNVKCFDNFDEFIDSGLFDAVVLCNYFNEHVPFAVQAMKRGIHVLSECTPAITMAECVLLCRTVEETSCKYMLAENYPYFSCNMEMKRRYETGKFGRAVYCEGEYNHPVNAYGKNSISPGRMHWRNWTPRTYYLTHALAPILYITGGNMKAVNCKCVFAPDNMKGTACRSGDILAIMLCELDNGALARVTGVSAWGGHGNWYRICGEKGNMQSLHGDQTKVRIQYDSWNTPEGEDEVQVVDAKWYEDEELNALAGDAGHGGGDYWVCYRFAKYILEDEAPDFDVYRSVSLSATAILGYRSALGGGAEYKIPDFRNEEERKLWENDHDSPYPDENGAASLPTCSNPDFRPSDDDYANAEKDWAELGIEIK